MVSEQTPLPTIQPDIMDAPNHLKAAPLMAPEPEILRGHIPAGHIPKPVVIADYVAWVLPSRFRLPAVYCAFNREALV